MNIYKVVSISTGLEVYRYQSEQPIEWDGMSFSTHIHELLPTEYTAPYVYNGPWKITKLAFRNRFTLSEKLLIELNSLDRSTNTVEKNALAAQLRIFLKDVEVATFIDLSRPDTRIGVQQLEQLGLLAAGRATAILDTVPTELELYKETTNG